MRILIQMGDSYPDESPCAKRMRVFHDVFKENGDEVIVLAPKDNNSNDETEDVIYCDTIPLKRKNTVYRLLNSFVFALNSYKEARKLRNIDVVITTTPPPLINWFGYRIAKYHGAKLIYDVRDIWPDVAVEMGSFSEASVYYRCFKKIRDFMIDVSDIIITVSPGKVRKLRSYRSTANIYEITNGLDEVFLRNSINEYIVNKYEINRESTVCYIGNLGLAQGLKQLLDIAKRALAENVNARFVLFGSGVEAEELRKYVEQNQLTNVVFPGRIPNRDIFTVLSMSRVCFVPLVNEKLTDSVPTKLFEALGTGCPVLLAACGDSADILTKSQLGIAVKPNDQEALWKAFLEIFNNADKYSAKKEYALNYILKYYSRQKAARRLQAILHESI